ncbi:MAG: hypothetical protein JEZ03_17685, partial [Bacteroidales bacterium]|nr:hypothetical protein [Bacteroidales bacterium]
MKMTFINKLLRLSFVVFISLYSFVNVSQAQLTVTAIADPATGVCSGETVQLTVTVTGGSGNYTYAWVANPNTYVPDIQSPLVTPVVTTIYTVTVSDQSLPYYGTDQIMVTVVPYPTAFAGADGTMCETQNQFQLSGTAENYSSVQWSISPPEAGVIPNTGSLNTIFIPSDNAPETVILTLYAFPNAPCQASSNYYDQLTLTINPMPEVDAGNDALICEGNTFAVHGVVQEASSTIWTTSGSGYFSNSLLLNTTYNPSAGDYQSGAVTLTLKANAVSPCSGSITDQLTLSFEQAPEVNAGDDLDVCEDGSIQINATAANYSQLFWTTSGDGNFLNPNTVNPTYIPQDGDVTSGEVILTCHAQGNSPCVEVTDNVLLTIWTAPTADAGDDGVTCENTAFQLDGTSTYYNNILWISNGDGIFENPNQLDALYTPGAADILNEEVELILKATASDPCSDEVMDVMTLTVVNLPNVDAGNDATICSNGVLELVADVENYSAVLWTYDGDGTIANPNDLLASYTPGTADIAAGVVEITLTA